MHTIKSKLISRLQKDILQWEGYKQPPVGTKELMGLGTIESAFPNGVFPVGAVHEFLSLVPEQAAANCGFISGLLSTLMEKGGTCVWISSNRTLFPAAIKSFGVNPERIIFIELQKEKDMLWTMEEALKCEGLAAVIAEVKEISFLESRRLQLAVEHSKVTGFVLRSDPKKLSTTACVARWQIKPLPSMPKEGLPGVGFPRWEVELLKVRNGQPGIFQLEWVAGKFKLLAVEEEIIATEQIREAV